MLLASGRYNMEGLFLNDLKMRSNALIYQFNQIFAKIGRWPEKGQTLLELALIIALIALVVVVAMQLLGPQIATAYNQITF